MHIDSGILNLSGLLHLNALQELIILFPMNYERLDKQYTYKEQDPSYMGEPLSR